MQSNGTTNTNINTSATPTAEQVQAQASSNGWPASAPCGSLCPGASWSPIGDDVLTKITEKRRFTGYRCTDVTNGLFGSSRWIASFSRDSWSLRRMVSLTDLPFIPLTNSS